MALQTKNEFAQKCGIKKSEINIYVGRKKIVLTGEHIDDTLAINKAFYENRLSKGLIVNVKQQKIVVKNIEKQDDFDDQEEVETDLSTLPDDVDVNSLTYTQLEQLNKKLDAKKKREEIEILKVKLDKLHGVVIPTEQVKIIFSQHTKSVLEEFRNSIDKIIIRISKKKALTNNEVAEIRKEIVQDLNDAVNAAVDESKKNIKQIISEFSEKKNKGEKI